MNKKKPGVKWKCVDVNGGVSACVDGWVDGGVDDGMCKLM